MLIQIAGTVGFETARTIYQRPGSRMRDTGAARVPGRRSPLGRKDKYLDWLAYQRQVGLDPVAIEGPGPFLKGWPEAPA